MNKSESIAKLSAALSKAQSKLTPAKKKGENPYFKSKYATLETVWEACREVLAANDLAVIQSPQLHEESACLETLLTHSSGEWVRSLMPLMLTKQDPQTMGSALTYARRYALAAMIGIVQKDDDGEKAMTPVRNQTVDVKPISMKEMKDTILTKINPENPERLEAYLKYCKSKVDVPMRVVIEGWVKNPELFLTHYRDWDSKKKVDNTVDIPKDEDRAPSDISLEERA